MNLIFIIFYYISTIYFTSSLNNSCSNINYNESVNIQTLKYSYTKCNYLRQRTKEIDTIEIRCPLLLTDFINLIVARFELENLNYPKFKDICLANNLDSCNPTNIKIFSTLNLIHQLLTSKSAINGSVGDILKNPYFWHYIKPNPRHEICLVLLGRKLSECKPPIGFEQYKSFADIDRTPFLYWSDLISDEPKYILENGERFYSFGWCSEREMAYVSLVTLLKFKARIITSGNHSFTEILIPMKNTKGINTNILVKADQTFDIVNWTKSIVSKNDFKIPNDWYNRKAHSNLELVKLRKLNINPISSNRIISAIRNFQ